MTWQKVSVMERKREFVALASQAGANIKALCERFGISRTTGYALLSRVEKEGLSGLTNRSRRPKTSPGKTGPTTETLILEARATHPAWGACKLKRWLEDRGVTDLPATSTTHAILKRHDRIDAEKGKQHQAFIRFEHPKPNDLWQMDFKGYFDMQTGHCHPLTILDDHSRYVVCLAASDNERHETVQHHLKATFRRYGLPWRMTMDNGSPWGDATGHYTKLEVWLMRCGVKVSHSTPYHPQTQGKDERFHRTLKAELLQGGGFTDLIDTQAAFDTWLAVYNLERPHEALAMATPVTRYRPSHRVYPEVLAEWVYDERDVIRRVQKNGELHFEGHVLKLGKAFVGERVAIRQDQLDGQHSVFLGALRISRINLKKNEIISGKWID